jgi:hypothetical protein
MIFFPTYSGGNGPREADNGEAAQLVLEDGRGGLWCGFGSDDGFGGGGDDG